MAVILPEFERLDQRDRHEALRVLERWYGPPTDRDARPHVVAPAMSGRRFGDNARRILDCLRTDGPATPKAVEQRTGVANSKQIMNRLERRGHLRVEGRGLYHFVSYPPDAQGRGGR